MRRFAQMIGMMVSVDAVEHLDAHAQKANRASSMSAAQTYASLVLCASDDVSLSFESEGSPSDARAIKARTHGWVVRYCVGIRNQHAGWMGWDGHPISREIDNLTSDTHAPILIGFLAPFDFRCRPNLPGRTYPIGRGLYPNGRLANSVRRILSTSPRGTA